MIVITRILIGAAGALFVLLALNFLFNTDAAAASVGLDVSTLAGRGTVRADMAGYFLSGGLISLYAAIKNNGGYLWPAMLLLITAFSGRVLTIIINGYEPASLPPMVIEAVLIALITYAQRNWNKDKAA